MWNKIIGEDGPGAENQEAVTEKTNPPSQETATHKGLFPWDKVFLELDQRGINVKIDTDAENRTVGLTASRELANGDMAHHSAAFTYETTIDAYEVFVQDAITALNPAAA